MLLDKSNHKTYTLHERERRRHHDLSTGLPENAFRELGADESYTPVMHPAHDQKEVTPYSVVTRYCNGDNLLGGCRISRSESGAGV